MWFLKCSFLISLIISAQCKDNAKPNDVHLTEQTFSNTIRGNNYLVFFYAPWCAFSMAFKPTWEEFVQERNAIENPKYTLARVNCDEQNDVCVDQVITRYPMLILYKGNPNAGEGIRFPTRAKKDLPTIKNFLREHLGAELDKEVKATKKSKPKIKEEVEVTEKSTPKIDKEVEATEKSTPKIDKEVEATEKSTQKIEATELSDDNFASHVSKGKHFIKFYAPWCGHCQRLASTWQELAEKLHASEDVKISKIDCTRNRPTCQGYDVKGYPSLLWFDSGKKIAKYIGKRDIRDLLAYVEKMSKAEPEEFEEEEENDIPVSAVLQLTAKNFHDEVQNGVVFVKFFAPWCANCKKLSPIWDSLATKMSKTGKVKIAKVDCTLEGNKELCQDEQVEAYPTLFVYKEGVKVAEYNGARYLDDLEDFVTKYEERDEL